MKYKILIVKNKYTKSPNLSKGLDWFKKNTPIEMDANQHISTNFDFTTKVIGNATYQGVIPGDEVYEKLRAVVKEGEYHCVVFLYGNDMNGIRVNATQALPLYPGTDLIYLVKDTDKGNVLNHELFHTFFHRLQRQQVMVEDPMDSVVVNGQTLPYYNNDDLDAVPSNRSIALGRIAPYWDKVANILVLGKPPVTPTVPETTYKFFKMSEATGRGHTFSELDPKLRAILDASRDKAGVPFVLTSGFRTVAENKAVGGVANSSHTKGLAADILCTDGIKLSAILRGILNCGTPVFLEVANKHVHIDIDAGIHPMGKTIIEPSDD